MLLEKLMIIIIVIAGKKQAAKKIYDKQNMLMWSKDATDFTWHDLITQQLLISQHPSPSSHILLTSFICFLLTQQIIWENEKKY